MAEAPNTYSGRTDDPDDNDMVTEVHRRYRDARDATTEWRDQARDSFDFEAGRQWSQQDLSDMREQNRIAVTFNRVSRAINAVVGNQIQNRQETRYIPREIGDVQVSEIYSAAADWVRDNCDAEDEETDAFTDCLITGMGWTETRLDTEEDPEGQVLIERIDPMWMYWDPSARRKNLSDRRWQMLVRRIPQDEFDERWPDADVSAAGSPWDEADDTDDHESPRRHVYPQDAYEDSQRRSSGRQDNRIRVAQYQWYEKEDVYRIGPSAVRFSATKFNRMKKALDEAGVRWVKQVQRKHKQAFVAGNVVLEEGDAPVNGFTFHPLTGKRDRNENVWVGLVHVMKDPQRWGNKLYSSIIDIINKNSKGGVIAEKDAFDDPRQVEQTWARPDAVHWARPGAVAQKKIMPKPMGEYPAGLDRLMAFSMENIHEAAGLPLESMGVGQSSQPQAGVVEYQRRQQGLTMLAPFFDSLRLYRKVQGRTLLDFINEYISDDRLIRITGKDGNEEYVPLTKQVGTVEYDIIVDESPTSPNQKDKVFNTMQQMLPALTKMGVPVPKEVLDYSPIPSQLAQKWKELIEKAEKQQTEGPSPQVQLEIAERDKALGKLSEENKKLKDKREETMANLQIKKMEGDQKASMGEKDLQRKWQEMQMEMERDREKFQHQLALDREKAAAEDARKREQAENDLAVAFAKMEIERANKMDGDATNTNLINQAIKEAVEAVVSKPKRKVTVQRDDDGLLIDATIENVLEDLDTVGEA